MNRQTEILINIKKQLQKESIFVVNYPEESNITKWFWIGTRDKIIGTNDCHYEFIFHDKNTLCLEVHFENENTCNNFENIQNNDHSLSFLTWGDNDEHKRITSEDYKISIQNKTIEQIVTSALLHLQNLDNKIGNRLEQILHRELTLNQRRNLPTERNYKKRYKEYKRRFYSNHTRIQQNLENTLTRKELYDIVVHELPLNNIICDLIGVNYNNRKNIHNYIYDIFEIKPYQSPTDCIREALGQLLLYKYTFEKYGYNVRKLFIVGPIALERNDKNYLDSIKNSLSFNIDYIPENQFGEIQNFIQ